MSIMVRTSTLEKRKGERVKRESIRDTNEYFKIKTWKEKVNRNT